jgi:hypothetical protein
MITQSPVIGFPRISDMAVESLAKDSYVKNPDPAQDIIFAFSGLKAYRLSKIDIFDGSSTRQ